MLSRMQVSRCCCKTGSATPELNYAELYLAAADWDSYTQNDPIQVLGISDAANSFRADYTEQTNQQWKRSFVWKIHFGVAVTSVSTARIIEIGGRSEGQSVPDFVRPDSAHLVLRGWNILKADTWPPSTGNPFGVPRSQLTTAYTDWSIGQWPLWNEPVGEYQTPDLSVLVNEVLSQPGFDSLTHWLVILAEVTSPQYGEWPSLSQYPANHHCWRGVSDPPLGMKLEYT